MGGKHRMVLGRYQDARVGAERVVGEASWSWREEPRNTRNGSVEYNRMVNAAVERVRRRFGNKYAKVARAYFNRKPWQKTGLPRRTFYHALKKVKEFFQADK